jgi:uncharacterized glyoxalase superfamily protein PhnB
LRSEAARAGVRGWVLSWENSVMNTMQTKTRQNIYPSVRYDDARAAVQWLTSVLGFEEHVVYTSEGGSIQHAELKLGGGLIMLGSVKDDPYGKSPRSLGGVSGGIYIAFDTPAEIDAAYFRAKGAGAEIVRELSDTDYGSHDFAVRDPEGHTWSFGTYRPQAS